MKKKQTQIRQYAKIMSVFLVAVVIGLLIFFYCIQRSVEHRSQKNDDEQCIKTKRAFTHDIEHSICLS